jgi:predicted N-formylglutamate amidohydrolase
MLEQNARGIDSSEVMEQPEPPMPTELLDADEPRPVIVENETGASPFVITCDHAGNRLPRRLGTLGLGAAELERHIAWDIGAAGVASRLAARIDAILIGQTYSRLVIDCNRAPYASSSIVALSEATPIPGNAGLSAAERDRRRRTVFDPYHARIAAVLDERRRTGQPTVLLALHSFTPVFLGASRPWQCGILYNRDPRFAHIVGKLLRARGLVVGDNEPYAVSDATDYTIPVHGERRGLPHLELEIRQDLIAAADVQQAWAELLAVLLPEAWRQLAP